MSGKGCRAFISIHALREESDAGRLKSVSTCSNFNPRSPWGERRERINCNYWHSNFNPRSPWGERHISPPAYLDRAQKFQSTLSVRRATLIGITTALKDLFQSTLSVRRATPSKYMHTSSVQISIHALREESDSGGGWSTRRMEQISIHALREESD